MLRLPGFLILATVLTVPAQAQRVLPGLEPTAGASVFRMSGTGPVDSMVASPRHRPGSLSLERFLKRLPPAPRAEVGCPMPVLRPQPRSADSMPVLTADSSAAPAFNQRVVLPACDNDYSR